MNKPTARPKHTFRLLEAAVQVAKVAAAKRRLPMGQWLEQAIADRAKQDEEDNLDKVLVEFAHKPARKAGKHKITNPRR